MHIVVCLCSQDELFQNDSHDEEQGIEQFHSGIEFHAFFEGE